MTAPTHYSYDPVTRELLGSAETDTSPLEADVYLLPAYATHEVPPALADKQAAIFIDGIWAVYPDHRNETWWKDGEPYTLATIGDPTLEDFLENGPPTVTAKQLAVWQNDAWVITPDHRGETWYRGHGQPEKIEEIGDPAERGLFADEPEAPPPSTDPKDYNLDRFQFIWMLRKLGIKDQVFTVANVMPEDTEEKQDYKFEVLTLLEEGQTFHRAHPAFDQLAPAVGITPEIIDTNWMVAKDKQPLIV